MGLPSKVPVVFGDIGFNIKLVTAVDDEDSGFHMVCNDGHAPARVSMPAICTSCEKRGTRYSFPRGKETENGLVVVTPEELAEAIGEPVKQMVVTAHPLKDVLENTFPGKSYLTVPSDAVSVEAYSLVRQALVDNPDTALVCTYAVQSNTKMWRLGLNGDALAVTELAWPEKVRARPAIPRVEVIPELRELANEWLGIHTEAFDPTAYKDVAKAAREALVAEKAGTAVPLQAVPTQVPANVSMTLLEKLRRSVEEKAAADAAPPAKKAPAKKATAKKAAPAKKTTARKTAARKTA